VWLTEQQIEKLTRRKRPSAQIRVLAQDGIPFRVVAGRPIVIAKDLETSNKRVRRLA
jgi:hypothetical protein